MPDYIVVVRGGTHPSLPIYEGPVSVDGAANQQEALERAMVLLGRLWGEREWKIKGIVERRGSR